MGAILALLGSGMAWAKDPTAESITKAVQTQLYEDDPQARGGLVEVSDGYKFVQCWHLPRQTIITCEAAGKRGQPWMRHVLTKERRAALKEMGFTADRQTGNFIRRWDPPPEPQALVAFMIHALDVGYGKSGQDPTMRHGWFPAADCPARVAAGNPYGGAIAAFGTPVNKLTEGCRLEGQDDDSDDDPLPPRPHKPDNAPDLLSQQYKTIAEAVDWVADGTGPERHIVIFSWGDFYIQCLKAEDPSMQCEVVSADIMPRLKPVLNAAAGRRLEKLGFLEPGYSLNYAQNFPLRNDARDKDVKAIAETLAQAAQQGFGTYVFLPLEVERHTSKPTK
ncbi:MULTISPECIES: hypothetical protein [Nitrospirillum]|uniref:Uncharacterized protein n=1 Tax=Nitrospirillum amazonense TaxID=28077 RepID=A0A560EWQ7_9PROT|nr:hypothetical protein [Nitrospirillum amazonense]MEC4594512.1 hypothetical protein [Nitrospirillum amazonense]TWB13773.1 hypothetical protein FBZ88_13525 [Nitrospirillum amazonense]